MLWRYVALTKKTCLVLLPSRTKTLENRIIKVLNALHIQPLTAKSMLHPTYSIISKLQDIIKDSDFVIADVTKANPNIMLELGFCLAYEKPLVILARRRARIPFDIHDLAVIEYDQTPKGLRKLEMSLKETLASLFGVDRISPSDVYVRSKSLLQLWRLRKAQATGRVEPKNTARLAGQILELSDSYTKETAARFESLISDIFANEGFKVISSMEKSTDWPVDFVLQVPGRAGFLLAECKNRNITSPDISYFSSLLDNRHLNKGVVLTRGQITKSAEDRILRELKSRGILIIPFDRSDFEKVAQGENLKTLLNGKITKAALSARLAK